MRYATRPSIATMTNDDNRLRHVRDTLAQAQADLRAAKDLIQTDWTTILQLRRDNLVLREQVGLLLGELAYHRGEVQ